MTVHYTYFCEVCGLGSPSDWERRACERDCIAKLRAERDAYRKAKAENDERFQREAFDARQERDEQRRIKDQAFDRLAEVIRERDEARAALRYIASAAPGEAVDHYATHAAQALAGAHVPAVDWPEEQEIQE